MAPRRSSPLLVAAVAAAAGMTIAGYMGCTFTPSAASRRSLLLGGVVAGTAATVNADSASAGFGFGERVKGSDDETYSPYSLMGGGMRDADNIFKNLNDERVGRAREELTKSFDILGKLRPEIEAKHYNKVKQRTTMQLQTMRKHLEYLCEAKQNRKDLVDLKSKITEQLDYLTVDNRVKKTTESLKDYDTLMPLVNQFMEASA